MFWNVPKLTNKVDYPTTLVEWTTYELITPWAGTTWDSLIFSLLYVLFWVIVMSIMYKKKYLLKFSAIFLDDKVFDLFKYTETIKYNQNFSSIKFKNHAIKDYKSLQFVILCYNEKRFT